MGTVTRSGSASVGLMQARPRTARGLGAAAGFRTLDTVPRLCHVCLLPQGAAFGRDVYNELRGARSRCRDTNKAEPPARPLSRVDPGATRISWR
jgi:hypothetical protein